MTSEALRQMLDEFGVLDDEGLRQGLEDQGLPKTTMSALELLHWVLRRYSLRVVRDSESALRSWLPRDVARTLGVAVDVSSARDSRTVYDLIASWVTRTNDPRIPYHIVGVGTALATAAQRARAIELGLPVRAASPLGSGHRASEVTAAYQRLADLGFERRRSTRDTQRSDAAYTGSSARRCPPCLALRPRPHPADRGRSCHGTMALDVLQIAGTRHRIKRPYLLDEAGDPDVERYVRALNRALSQAGIRERFIAIKDSTDVRVVTIGFASADVAKQLLGAGF